MVKFKRVAGGPNTFPGQIVTYDAVQDDDYQERKLVRTENIPNMYPTPLIEYPLSGTGQAGIQDYTTGLVPTGAPIPTPVP